MEEGLRTGQFHIAYQPQYSLKTNRLVGFEALLRWTHPVHGIISPMEFIPIAESNGFIQELGYWVIETAAREVKMYSLEGFKLSVNASILQFNGINFAQNVVNSLLRVGYPLNNFILELTESVPVKRGVPILATLRNLRSYGVSIFVDDFGMGYSSMSYLEQFPISALKLDRSFISMLYRDLGVVTLFDEIIAMARSAGVFVVAEGVETIEQVRFLREHDCDLIQGYFLSPPLPIAQLHSFIQAFQSRHSRGII